MFAALIALLLGGAAFAMGGGSGGTTTVSTSPGPMRLRETDDTPGDIPDEPEVADAADDDPEPAALEVPPSAAPSSTPSNGDTPDLPVSAYALDWDGLTPEEQLIVELVNRARMDPQAEVARLDEQLASGISSTPKQALAVTPELSEAAREHSQDMDDRDYFAHTNPDGEQPWDRAVQEGHGSTFVGENLAVIGSSWTGFDTQVRAEDLHEGLWESDNHQRNLMNDRWSEIGTGYDYGTWNGYAGSTFVTELFSDRGHEYLTGVVIDDEDGDEFYDMGEGQGGVQITAIDEADENNVYTTSTWESGGYTLRLPAGTYRVVFEGGDLERAQEATVTIGEDNVKLDIIEGDDEGRIFASATLEAENAGHSAYLPELPAIEDEDTVPLEDEEELEAALL